MATIVLRLVCISSGLIWLTGPCVSSALPSPALALAHGAAYGACNDRRDLLLGLLSHFHKYLRTVGSTGDPVLIPYRLREGLSDGHARTRWNNDLHGRSLGGQGEPCVPKI